MYAIRFGRIVFLCMGITLIHSGSADVRVTEECATPYGSKGKCKLMKDCPQALNLVENPPQEIQKHLEGYLCKSEEVCCVESELNEMEVPRISYCGLQYFDDVMIDSGQSSIFRSPWIVAIVRKSKTGVDEITCLGTLITRRYVITSGFCAKCEDLDDAKIWVRMGEFYGKIKSDCRQRPRDEIEECGEYEDIGIQEIIPHPFMSNGVLSFNHISLIRLNKSVTYNDFIRPICLQTPDMVPKAGDNLVASGWSKDQLKIVVPSKLITSNECTGEDHNVDNYVKCIKYQNINGPSENCEVVHNGAPVMLNKKFQWYLEGVSHLFYHSNGSCIARYTPLFAYKDWILQNLKP